MSNILILLKPFCRLTSFKRQNSLLSLIFSFVLINAGIAQIKPNANSQPSIPIAPIIKPNGYTNIQFVNFVRTWTPQYPTDNTTGDVTDPIRTNREVKQSTEYFDGLGRPIQTVLKDMSITLNQGVYADIIAPRFYDNQGRESLKFLPYSTAVNPPTINGKIDLDPFSNQFQYFQEQSYSPATANYNELIYYSKTVFESTPLGRPIKSFAPGNSWAGTEGVILASEHAVTISYEFNDNNEVRTWNIEPVQNYSNLPLPVSSGFYSAGELYRTTTKDENQHKTIEYKDKEGKIVLKKVEVGITAGNTDWLSTYYVYDNFGLLRFVIPPNATGWLEQHYWSFDSPT